DIVHDTIRTVAHLHRYDVHCDIIEGIESAGTGTLEGAVGGGEQVQDRFLQVADAVATKRCDILVKLDVAEFFESSTRFGNAFRIHAQQLIQRAYSELEHCVTNYRNYKRQTRSPSRRSAAASAIDFTSMKQPLRTIFPARDCTGVSMNCR